MTSGDAAARDQQFRGVVASHGPAIRRIARIYAGGDGDEDDLYQDILYQIWRALPSFRGQSSLGTWAYRVALNVGLGHRRRETRRRQTHDPVVVSADLPAPAASQASVEEAILEEFVGSLNPIDRSVLGLYMEGLKQQDIAEVTGLSVSAVGVRIHRLKQSFKRRYVER